MTEAEAKTKACCGPPMVACVLLAIEALKAGEAPINPTTCSGSHCMAWRWEHLGTNNEGDKLYSKTMGFCGLAGSPQ